MIGARFFLFLTIGIFSSLTVRAAEPAECADQGRTAVADAAFDVACAKMQAMSDQDAATLLKKSANQCRIGAYDGGWTGLGATWEDLKTLAGLIPGTELTQHVKNLIHDLWDKRENPVSGAADTAEASVENQMSFVDRVRELPKRWNSYWLSVATAFRKDLKIFWCLPVQSRTEAICHSLTATSLEFALLGASAKDFTTGIKFAKATKDFLTEARLAKGMANLSTRESLEFATAALRDAEKGHTLKNIGDASLVEYSDPATGGKYMKLEEEVQGSDGKIHKSSREVQVDAKTGAIDANTEIGRALLEKATRLSASGEKQSVIFTDINHLGVTNYYQGGTATGDSYIKSVGSVIRSNIGEKDLFFKLGGDELAVIVKSSDPKTVRAIAENISRGIAGNPEARAIFKNEVVQKSAGYRSVNRASSLDELPPDLQAKLSSQQRVQAQDNFEAFKKTYLKDQVGQVIAQARYRPTVSIGSTVIGKNDSFAIALERAEKQETANKIEYKKSAGFSLSKYGGSEETLGAPNFKVRPEIQDPIPAPSNLGDGTP